MSKTSSNLNEAFAGESQANRRYLAFARKAEEEGKSQVANLFRAAAEAETVHALNHIKITGEVKNTVDNLKTAISGETFEFTEMYPQYIEEAKKEGNKQAAWSFDVANKVEQIHAYLFKKTVEKLKDQKDIEKVDYYVCSVCGNTVEREPPEQCPVCGNPKSKFNKIE